MKGRRTRLRGLSEETHISIPIAGIKFTREKNLSQPMNGIRVCGQTIVETSTYTTVRRVLPV